MNRSTFFKTLGIGIAAAPTLAAAASIKPEAPRLRAAKVWELPDELKTAKIVGMVIHDGKMCIAAETSVWLLDMEQFK
jgi:hypothetical protein